MHLLVWILPWHTSPTDQSMVLFPMRKSYWHYSSGFYWHPFLLLRQHHQRSHLPISLDGSTDIDTIWTSATGSTMAPFPIHPQVKSIFHVLHLALCQHDLSTKGTTNFSNDTIMKQIRNVSSNSSFFNTENDKIVLLSTWHDRHNTTCNNTWHNTKPDIMKPDVDF